MAVCEVCGMESEDAFQLTRAGESHVFDSFQCAIHAMADTCLHCGCRILGNVVWSGDRAFCCEHCANVQS